MKSILALSLAFIAATLLPAAQPLPQGGETPPPPVAVDPAACGFASADPFLPEIAQFLPWQLLAPYFAAHAEAHAEHCRAAAPFNLDRPAFATQARLALTRATCWRSLATALDPRFDDADRAEARDLLADLLGEQAFAAGAMPAPIGQWQEVGSGEWRVGRKANSGVFSSLPTPHSPLPTSYSD